MTNTERQRSYYHLLNQHSQAQLNYIKSGFASYPQNGPVLSNYISNAINNIGTPNSYPVLLPHHYYKDNDKYLYAFLNNIPSDIMGLMDILYEVQNPNQTGAAFNDANNVAAKNTNSANQLLSIQVFI